MMARGLETMNDWEERKKESDLYIMLNTDPSMMNGDLLKNIRNAHFQLTKKEFDETVKRANRIKARDTLKHEIQEGKDLIKYILLFLSSNDFH